MANLLNVFSENCLFIILLVGLVNCDSFAYPDKGKWDFHIDQKSSGGFTVVKSLFKESEIRIQITCDPEDSKQSTKLTISWSLTEVSCWRDFLVINEELSRNPNAPINDLRRFIENASLPSIRPEETVEEHDCSNHNIILKEFVLSDDTSVGTDIQSESANVHGMPILDAINHVKSKRDTNSTNATVSPTPTQQVLKKPHTQLSSRPIVKTTKDGFYLFSLEIMSSAPFSSEIHLEMKGKHGYLSAADWPLLPFYGAMCLVYVVLGLAWLIVSFLQWRDLLRIQFWIGGVILLGMLEKAMFYAEYQSINTTGYSDQNSVLVAELVSCGKRTLARMLVIIVSLGFGIVKPRLGPMLHRTVATGMLYFLLAASEAYLRIMKPKSDPANQMLVASVPLAVLDSAICWWIFSSLVQTTRTLRLRRNLVKLNLYRHFTNTLIFAVISSVVFMLYSIKAHYLASCFTAWKELWIDDAYWKLLFSVILLVIMILWRPTNNNQRYAFTPLLDAPEDGDDEEEEYFVSDAFGVKMRGGLNSGANSPKQKLLTNTAEDDLKWVEENIPTSLADSALPILDSDEEIMNTKFELSKMQ